MAVLPVTLSEMLRPWYFAGVSHFWPDPDAPELEPEIAAMLRPGGVMPRPPGGVPAGVAGAAARAPVGTRPASVSSDNVLASGASPAGAAGVSGSRPAGGAVAAPAPNTAARPGSIHSGVSPSPTRVRTTPVARTAPAALTPPRQALLERTPRAPILWTYPELGADLAGQGDPRRSACLRGILGGLHLPKGTSCFWPLRLPVETPDEAVAQFLSGLEHLHPRAVIFFGIDSIALCGLPISLATPFTQHLHGGKVYLLLPDLDKLIAEPGLSAASATFLAGQFSGLPGLAGS